MDWLEAVVHTTTMGADIVSDVLMNAGAALYIGGKAESMRARSARRLRIATT